MMGKIEIVISEKKTGITIGVIWKRG